VDDFKDHLFDLSGTVSLVTGAGQNVGRGIARLLGLQGSTVIVNDIKLAMAEKVADEIEKAGGRAFPQIFDVTDAEAVAAGVAASAGKVGPVDILVNNAGSGGALPLDRKPFLDHGMDAWEKIMAVNVYGVVHCTRAVLPAMVERNWGRIITISSGLAFHSQVTGYSHYGAAKAAPLSLMRHIAEEFGPHNITANSVLVGQVSDIDNDAISAVIAALPTRRRGTPADIAALCVYLASREAGWMTAQSIHANGGQYGT
jgi:NAD(P)-dependent dehydrogenase (short-subunit alcohol dehydrogenase family)